MTDTPMPPTGSFYGDQIVAAVIVSVLFVAASRLHPKGGRSGHGGLVTGADNRYSTSRTVAVGWTMVVAWMVVAEALISTHAHGPTFSSLLSGASNLYFVLLGGPYAAAAFALLSTSTKVDQGTLVKTPAEAPTFGDVISDDNGNADTYDFQYALFNLLAMVIVVATFFPHPGKGLPEIPQFLAILAGGSALTYTVNKTLASTGPAITKIEPKKARCGDIITITGVQLISSVPGAAFPTVLFEGVPSPAVVVAEGNVTSLTAVVPSVAEGTVGLTGDRDVTVTPTNASPVVLHGGFAVVDDEPSISQVDPPVVVANGALTVKGTWLLAPGTPSGTLNSPRTAIGGLTASLKAPGGQEFPVQFAGEYSNAAVRLAVGDAPNIAGKSVGDSVELTLKLDRDGVASSERKVTYMVS